jgi:hypothetical protein
MRKGILYAVLITLICPGQARGQLVDGLGLKAGILVSNQTHRFTPIDYTMDTDPVMAPAAALFLELFRGRSFSIQADLACMTRGNTTTTRSVTVNHLDQDRITENKGDAVTSKFRYLSFSPAVRVRTGFKHIIPYAIAGPRMDVHLSYSTDSDYPLEEMNRLIVGLTFGIGMEYNSGRTGLFLEAEYQPDLTPVTDREPLLISNSSLFVAVGIRRSNIR